ncbi:hypothetical protein [Bacillus sp. SM2101]|uniref:hypothetical protein n=1 Tax=Bacillus sp. SM2101 TaxID=2805366 RepID=UPI001BDE4D0A|nr:hypothetical protein [Bacillus sp. SM2101]
MLELDKDDYMALKKYIASRSREKKVSCNGNEFLLIHTTPPYSRRKLRHFPDMEINNQFVIFGHIPVAQIHRDLSTGNFDFNYKEILTYVDRNNNHYFNLDMSGNTAGVLRLDDFEDFYVTKYKRNPKTRIESPTIPMNKRNIGYKMVDGVFLHMDINKYEIDEYQIYEDGFSFITYKDFCMEYLIGVNKDKNEILGEYYIRTHKHMIPEGVEVIEYDVENKIVKTLFFRGEVHLFL